MYSNQKKLFQEDISDLEMDEDPMNSVSKNMSTYYKIEHLMTEKNPF